MALSREEVLRLAELSRLSLSEAEIVKMEATLDPILEYVTRLSSVDTAGVPESEELPIPSARLRPDVAAKIPDGERSGIISNFPDRSGDLLKVPGVFEKPKGSKEQRAESKEQL